MATLDMKHINKKFGSGHTEVDALTDINFSVNEGEFVSVIGPQVPGKAHF